MRAYTKPLMQVERFAINEAIANGQGCEHHDATDPTSVTVYCYIGRQNETVFYNCGTSATKSHIIDSYGGKDYFIWYTYEGDGASQRPSDSATAMLAKLVSYAGETPGSGWHYAEVDASGTDAFDTFTIS